MKTTLAVIPLMLGLGFAATPASSATFGGPAGTECTVTDFDANIVRGDVRLTVGADTYIPTLCHGVYVGDPNGFAAERDLLETNYGNFDLFLKTAPDESFGALTGLTATISFDDEGADAGTWLITVNGIGDDPVSLDIGVLLKQSVGAGTWFLDDVIFTDENNDGVGTYQIRWCGGADLEICDEPVTDLSHMVVALRLGDPREPPTGAPEPGSLLLLGLGMAGLALMQRRRRPV